MTFKDEINKYDKTKKELELESKEQKQSKRFCFCSFFFLFGKGDKKAPWHIAQKQKRMLVNLTKL
jgi:hypothetical protein